jgi:hypothetical protein
MRFLQLFIYKLAMALLVAKNGNLLHRDLKARHYPNQP